MRRKAGLLLAVLTVFLLISTLNAEERVQVHVSVLPQKFFVEQIAEGMAEVAVLVTPGKSPTTYSPTPAQIKKLARAAVYFRIGVPFENGFMHKIRGIAPEVRVVDTRQGIVLRTMEAHIHDDGGRHDEHGHAHHGEDRHSHVEGKDQHHGEESDNSGHGTSMQIDVGGDPHIWMDPMLVKQQAATITDTLSELAPAHAVRFRENFERFAGQLDRLHDRLKTLLAPLEGENFFVFHPAFGYFGDAYGLKQISVETMGRAPKGKELSAIIKLARQEKVRVIFVQPQFDQQAARKIAQTINGAAVAAIDPLAYAYLDNMEHIADIIARAMIP